MVPAQYCQRKLSLYMTDCHAGILVRKMRFIHSKYSQEITIHRGQILIMTDTSKDSNGH